MNDKIRIFLADPSQDFLELLSAELSLQPDLAISGRALRGDAAYAQLISSETDILIMDILLPGLDGIGLLRRLKAEGVMPRTVILSAFISAGVAEAASFLGVDDYLPKPCDMTELIRRIREIDGGKSVRARAGGYEIAVREALMKFGVNSHLNGYGYLIEAIYAVLDDRSKLHGVTKILYPDLGKQFGTNGLCIERSIRSAVDKAWNKTAPESRRAYFGDLFDSYAGSPSNIHFINAIVDFIELRFTKEDIWKTR